MRIINASPAKHKKKKKRPTLSGLYNRVMRQNIKSFKHNFVGMLLTREISIKEDVTMGTQGEEDLDLRGNSCHREEEQEVQEEEDRRLKLGFFDLSARESEEEGGGGIKGSVRGTRSLIGRDELIYLSYPNTADNFSSLP